MNIKRILTLLGLILLIVAFIVFKPFKKNEQKNGKPTVITSLTELFPTKATTFKYKEKDNEYKVKITDIKKENDTTIVVTKQDIVNDGVTTTIEMTYQITPEKIVELGKYIIGNEIVSVIYPTELLIGMPYENMSWKSADNLITNTVVSMKNNQVTIESIRVIDTYEDGKGAPVKKDYKETRIFEKGEGIVLFRTEIVGDKATVSERKLVK